MVVNTVASTAVSFAAVITVVVDGVSDFVGEFLVVVAVLFEEFFLSPFLLTWVHPSFGWCGPQFPCCFVDWSLLMLKR